MVQIANGVLGGIPPFGTVAGCACLYPPHWALIDDVVAALTTTATRLYFIPYYFQDIVAYTGIKTRNNGAGDNLDTYRVGVYQKSVSTNLPTTLIQDLGEVTLSGAAADRTLAVSFTPAYIGWHYLAMHFNQGSAMQRMLSALYTTNVGSVSGMQHIAGALFGTAGTSASVLGNGGFAAFYIDTAYGALAATAVTPTAVTSAAPSIYPYRT